MLRLLDHLHLWRTPSARVRGVELTPVECSRTDAPVRRMRRRCHTTQR